jgi:hypothetical protein
MSITKIFILLADKVKLNIHSSESSLLKTTEQLNLLTSQRFVKYNLMCVVIFH